MRLGVQGVRGVCLMSSLAREALAPGPLLGLRRKVWRECLASALTCQAIAGFHGGVSTDEAWLLGLLHDFGKVVALTAIEPDVDPHRAAVLPFWADVMERHHCDVGWIVTDKWRLPPRIPRHHRDPPPARRRLRIAWGRRVRRSRRRRRLGPGLADRRRRHRAHQGGARRRRSHGHPHRPREAPVLPRCPRLTSSRWQHPPLDAASSWHS